MEAFVSQGELPLPVGIVKELRLWEGVSAVRAIHRRTLTTGGSLWGGGVVLGNERRSDTLEVNNVAKFCC